MKKKIITILLSFFMIVGVACIPGINAISPLNISAEAATVSSPRFSKSAGRYNAAFKLSLSAASNAKIYYTTNGKTPTANSALYTGRISITKTTTVKAIAVTAGVKSNVVSKKYTISPKKPTCSLTSGTYSGEQRVTLACSTSGAKIYYTLDGKAPTTKSMLYTGAITISESCKLRAVAIKTGFSKSLYLTRTFTIENEDSFTALDLDSYKNKYGYNSLSSNEKLAYDRIYKAVTSMSADVDISGLGISKNQLAKVYFSLHDDNPWLFYMDNSYSCSFFDPNDITTVKLSYAITSSEYNAALPKLQASVDAIMKKVNAKSEIFDKLLVMHDEIVNNCKYTSSGKQIANAYGCIVNGKALCEGYSRAFQLLCHEAGIQNILVTGVSNGEDHMWNMLELDDEWYHFDLTWDDPVSNSDDNVSYDYFNLTTAQIKEDHSIDDAYYPIPNAYGTKYNYYTYNGITVYKTTSTAVTEIKRLIKEAVKTKQTEVSIMCIPQIYNGIVADFIQSNDYLDLFKTLNAVNDNTLALRIMYGYQSLKFYEVTITLYYE